MSSVRGVHVNGIRHGFICIGLVFIKVSGRGAGLLRDLPLQIMPSLIRRYLRFMELYALSYAMYDTFCCNMLTWIHAWIT